MKSLSSITCVLALAAFSAAAHANATADAVINYDPGAPSSTPGYQLSGNAALGLPATTDGYGTDVTPFTPPFSSADLTQINAGGHITLHLAAPITAAIGPQLAVFTNVGLIASADSDPNNPTATTFTFSAPSQATVSVSATGLDASFIALNGGNPITFDNPANAFTDSTVTYDTVGQYTSAYAGTVPSDFFQPFTGTVNSFDGQTYSEILTLLNGSAGGNWIDVSSANLPQINYVRFDVPAGDNLILDAITAVPEPSSLGLCVIGLIALARRRQR